MFTFLLPEASLKWKRDELFPKSPIIKLLLVNKKLSAVWISGFKWAEMLAR